MDFSSCGVFGGLIDLEACGAFGVRGAVSAFVFRAGLLNLPAAQQQTKLSVRAGVPVSALQFQTALMMIPKMRKLRRASCLKHQNRISSGVVKRGGLTFGHAKSTGDI